MVAAHAEHFELALRAEDATACEQPQARVFLSIENVPGRADLSLLETFYKLESGCGPGHFLNTSSGDSFDRSQGAKVARLEQRRSRVVAEANRWASCSTVRTPRMKCWINSSLCPKTPVLCPIRA